MPSTQRSLPVIEILYCLFFVGLTCSFHAFSSIAVGLLALIGLFSKKTTPPGDRLRRYRMAFLFSCLIFFLFQCISLAYTGHTDGDWDIIKIKTAILFTPLAFWNFKWFDPRQKKILHLLFAGIVIVVSMICLFIAIWNYSQAGSTSVFFYHNLVAPIEGHAVYFAVLVFAAILVLLEDTRFSWSLRSQPGHKSAIIFLSIFLLLLSSKLVISFYLLYLLSFSIRMLVTRKISRITAWLTLSLVLLGTVTLLLEHNPVSNRFRDLFNGRLDVTREARFNPAMYFNGAQFRLLHWRFTGEILTEQHSWWTGTGQSGSQHAIDEKYIQDGMYVGDPARGDRGFLGYNTHNQFLETILQTGIPGLLILLFVCFCLGRLAWANNSRSYRVMVALLLAWLFTESVLERQNGVMTFVFLGFFL
jgi:O-antigen ligase